MKNKEPADKHISILKQTLVASSNPPRTSHCLNTLQSHPEPQLSAQKPHKEQAWD